MKINVLFVKTVTNGKKVNHDGIRTKLRGTPAVTVEGLETRLKLVELSVTRNVVPTTAASCEMC